MHFAKGYEAPATLVPKNHAYTPEALEQRKPPEGSKLRMTPQHLWQPVIRDSTAQMVDVVHPDIGGEPAQDARQIIVRTAVQCRLLGGPVVVVLPECILELVLDIEQPDAERRCEKRNRQGMNLRRPAK